MSSEIHALSGAYAVGAVNDLERAEFERHLAECSECRAEVASLREAAAALAIESEVEPPASLRASVLDEITRIRPLPPLANPALSPSEPRLENDSRDSSTPPGTVPREGGARRWFPLLVAAAVLGVIGIGGAVWQPWNQGDQSSQGQLSASERVLQAPDAEAVSLDFPDGSSATVTRSKAEGRAVITTTDMAPPPSGRVYELWLQQEDGSMVAACAMPQKADQTVVLDGAADEAIAAGITIEPEGGSEQPTSDPIALFDFSEST